MFALISSLVVFLMILFLIFPEAAQDLLMARVPVEVRPNPNRYGMRLVPAVAIFVFGFAMFRGWDQLLHRPTSHLASPLQIRLSELAAIVFIIAGLSGCILSPQLLKKLAPRISDDSRKARTLIMGIQLFGVICVLVAVQLFRRSVQ